MWRFRVGCSLMKRLVVVLGLLGAALVHGRKPNILILLADDLGYGDLGCYGNTTLRTPSIDGLARAGVKMTQHLASASVCTPSRAAMLTGRHAVRSGMAPIGVMRVNTWVASRSGLPSNEVTMAEVAKEAGYKTALIGKWHLGLSKETYGDNEHHPLNQGFDYFFGFIGTNLEDYGDEGQRVVQLHFPWWYWQLATVWAVTASALYCLYRTGFIRASTFLAAILLWTVPVLATYLLFDNYTLLSSMLHRNYDVVEQPIILDNLSPRFTREGLEFMDECFKEDKPFLLFMSWNHMHTFIKTAKHFVGRTSHGRYGDAVEELDWSVGELLNRIDDAGQRNNTLIYFTSDNGGHLELGVEGGYNGVLKGGKGHGAPDGGIRVPGIVSWPGTIPANIATDEPTMLMDFFNLVSKATGAALPKDRQLDGKDILPLLKGETAVSPHQFMYHYCGTTIHATRYRPRTGSITWKLVYYTPGYLSNMTRCAFMCSCADAKLLDPPLLYDVTADPGESSPLDARSDVYNRIAPVIEEATRSHSGSVEPVTSQFLPATLMWRPSLQPCCGGTFPFSCACRDAKYPDL